MRVALIGSARFESEFVRANLALTLAGHTVYGLSVYPSQAPKFLGIGAEGHEWYSNQQKTMLDLVHLSKIEESDVIVLINPEGYVGESTRREVLWCVVRDKHLVAVHPWIGTTLVNPEGRALQNGVTGFGIDLFEVVPSIAREFVFTWKPQG